MSSRRPTSRSATAAVLPAEPYGVTCACGQRHEGIRETEYQVLECNGCGRRLFVLSQCPYPEIDESAPLQHADGGAPIRRGRRSSRKRRAASTGVAQTPRRENEQKIPAATDAVLAAPRRKLVTPLRLVAVGIVAIFAATGFWQYQRSVRAQAERDFREHADRGDAALKDRDFVTAFAEYQQAVAALDKLDRDDAKARQVRQMFRECRAASDLATKTLPEILQAVERWSAADPEDWKQRFHTEYAGQWIVLNTTVRRAPAGSFPSSSLGTRIEFPLGIGGRAVELLVSGTAFDSLNPGDTPQRAILAVELATCELAGDRWIVRCNPQTAFLWSSFENYRALGFVVAGDPEAVGGIDEVETERALRDRLLTQSRLMGLSE
jgi:hypothetical protein